MKTNYELDTRKELIYKQVKAKNGKNILFGIVIGLSNESAYEVIVKDAHCHYHIVDINNVEIVGAG